MRLDDNDNPALKSEEYTDEVEAYCLFPHFLDHFPDLINYTTWLRSRPDVIELMGTYVSMPLTTNHTH